VLGFGVNIACLSGAGNPIRIGSLSGKRTKRFLPAENSIRRLLFPFTRKVIGNAFIPN